jgi:hypothetical protein
MPNWPRFSSLPGAADNLPRGWIEVVIPYTNEQVFARNGPAVLLTEDVLRWFFADMDTKEEWYVTHNPSYDNAAFYFLDRNDALRFKLTWFGL